MRDVPHPIPYQGSKRLLAPSILAHAGAGYATLFEPFAGSAALTLAAAHANVAARFRLGDSFEALALLWRDVIEKPSAVAAEYEKLWHAQDDDSSHYETVRDRFNARGGSARLLYLLARCVKAAVRFNQRGEFNQAPDRRRRGTTPARVRASLERASELLAGRATVRAGDFVEALRRATKRDLVYLDPPFQGTTLGKDRRYAAGLETARLLEVLESLRSRGVPTLVSYDGATGGRSYGPPLPRELGFRRVMLDAGRSSQATLLGRDDVTRESLYVSPECARMRLKVRRG